MAALSLNSPQGRRAILTLLLITAHPDCPPTTLEEARAALAPHLADLMDLLNPSPIAETPDEALKIWAVANFSGDRDQFAESFGQFFDG